ncbi:MAG: carboxypeptidase-like regulatory domain-containing protein [bacterium]
MQFNLNKNGFTLLEVVFTGVIITVVTIGILSLMTHISIDTLNDRNKIKADNFAQQLLEEAKAASGTGFEAMDSLSSPSIKRTEFPRFTANRSISTINSSGERDINVSINWEEGNSVKQSNYYMKLVKGSAPAAGGTITGYVKDTAGQPIEGATVWAPNILIGEADVTATTDANGFYTLLRTQTGTQPVTTQKLGSSPTSTAFEQGYYNSTDYTWFKSVDVTIGAAEILQAPDIVLEALGYISGKITDAYDAFTLVNNIGVSVYFNWGSQTRWWIVYTDISNPIGPYSDTYIIRNVRPPQPRSYYWGRVYRKSGSLYTLQQGNPSFEWGYCELGSTKILAADFVGGPPHATFSPSVLRLGWLTGRITDAITGLPIEDALVEADSHTDGSLFGYSVLTDSNGEYAYYNMYEQNRARYSSNPPVYASKAEYAKGEKSIAVYRNQANICDIELYPSDHIAVVTGTVLIKESDGSPNRLAGENEVQIYAERYDSTYNARTYTYAWTRSDGTYELGDVRPNFDPSEKRRIYFRLPGGIRGDIRGFISEDVEGIGLGGATVSCNTALGSYSTTSASTGATGFYELEDVTERVSTYKDIYLVPAPPPGNITIVDCTLNISKVSVRVTASKAGYHSQSRNTDLINNGQTDLNITITQQDICNISGTVTDSRSGNPVDNIRVRSGSSSTTTNSSGIYSMTGVSIGGGSTVSVSTDETTDYERGTASASGVNPGDTINNLDIVIDPKYTGM